MNPEALAKKALEEWVSSGEPQGLARVMAWANVGSIKRETEQGTLEVILKPKGSR